MMAVQDPRPQHRPGAAARSRKALSTALRTLRHVQDEQMRMWEAFYRTSTWDTRPQILDQQAATSSQAHSRALTAAGSSHRAA